MTEAQVKQLDELKRLAAEAEEHFEPAIVMGDPSRMLTAALIYLRVLVAAQTALLAHAYEGRGAVKHLYRAQVAGGPCDRCGRSESDAAHAPQY